jgi:predicted  nucleic acid-binding Zn-ribbon protein
VLEYPKFKNFSIKLYFKHLPAIGVLEFINAHKNIDIRKVQIEEELRRINSFLNTSNRCIEYTIGSTTSTSSGKVFSQEKEVLLSFCEEINNFFYKYIVDLEKEKERRKEQKKQEKLKKSEDSHCRELETIELNERLKQEEKEAEHVRELELRNQANAHAEAERKDKLEEKRLAFELKKLDIEKSKYDNQTALILQQNILKTQSPKDDSEA